MSVRTTKNRIRSHAGPNILSKKNTSCHFLLNMTHIALVSQLVLKPQHHIPLFYSLMDGNGTEQIKIFPTNPEFLWYKLAISDMCQIFKKRPEWEFACTTHQHSPSNFSDVRKQKSRSRCVSQALLFKHTLSVCYVHGKQATGVLAEFVHRTVCPIMPQKWTATHNWFLGVRSGRLQPLYESGQQIKASLRAIRAQLMRSYNQTCH